MQFHTDHLTMRDATDALYVSGLRSRGVAIDTERCSIHRSRKRQHRLDIYLVATAEHGRRYVNSGNRGAGYDKAATWREWGAFIAELYHRDPEMIAGYYGSARDFEEKAVRLYNDPPDEARAIEDWRTMFLDTASSASRQHFIDTGAYLRPGEAIEA